MRVRVVRIGFKGGGVTTIKNRTKHMCFNIDKNIRICARRVNHLKYRADVHFTESPELNLPSKISRCCVSV